MHLDFFIWANDADDALERSGAGASKEFQTVDDGARGFDPEMHVGKGLFQVKVEQVIPPREAP